MWLYTIRRLLLLPLTLFCIVLVNFVIVNLAPGDPASYAPISADGSKADNRSTAFGSDERYLHFREFYGLTLPVLFNTWVFTSFEAVVKTLDQLIEGKQHPFSKEVSRLKVEMGDKAQFVMPHLLKIIEDENMSFEERLLGLQFFVRGASRPAIVGASLIKEQKTWNNKITKDQLFLRSLSLEAEKESHLSSSVVLKVKEWYEQNKGFYLFEPSLRQKISLFFFETRFMTYMGRVLRLDFGTLRSDSNKTVISEVMKRFKYSLTLSLLPMGITFLLCQLFGFIMATHHGLWQDHSLNLFFLVLYAIPVFVVAPFLIEKVALYHYFPFSCIPIPINGFSSPERVYEAQNSLQRLLDILRHIALPLVAVMYTSLSAESRLSRTAVLEVMRQDYVRTARAKGVSRMNLMVRHIGRNAGITIVTSLAGSLGLLLSGSLIVETLFEINGFGKFFYDAVINRDYNVIMFSALAGAFMTLLGYLIADLTYMWLDPRIRLDRSR